MSSLFLPAAQTVAVGSINVGTTINLAGLTKY